jgi:hypothetical protein
LKHGFRYVDLFDQFDAQRKLLAAQLDSGQISRAQYQTSFQISISNLSKAINDREESLKEQYAENDRALGQALLGGIAAAERMRANADGAAAQALQQVPHHTTEYIKCEPNAINANQIDCTADKY